MRHTTDVAIVLNKTAIYGTGGRGYNGNCMMLATYQYNIDDVDANSYTGWTFPSDRTKDYFSENGDSETELIHPDPERLKTQCRTLGGY